MNRACPFLISTTIPSHTLHCEPLSCLHVLHLLCSFWKKNMKEEGSVIDQIERVPKGNGWKVGLTFLKRIM